METTASTESDADAINSEAANIDNGEMLSSLKQQLTNAGLTLPADLAAIVSQPAVTGPPEPPFVDACFPSDATVIVQGRGRVAMTDLRTRDLVLVQRSCDALLGFEPVLSFLHSYKGAGGHMAVLHEDGLFQATPGHLVLTSDGVYKNVNSLRPGDTLRVADSNGHTTMLSRVVSVRRSLSSDAYAPLTASGTVVVDGVVASNYASTTKINLKHSVAHAFHFPVRAYHAVLGVLGAWSAPQNAEALPELHPFLELMYRRLHIDSLHERLINGGESL
jgi:hypothetical protein